MEWIELNRAGVWVPQVGDSIEGIFTEEKKCHPHWKPSKDAVAPFGYTERSMCAVRADDGVLWLLEFASVSAFHGFRQIVPGDRVRFTCVALGKGGVFSPEEVVPKYKIELAVLTSAT